MKKIFFAALAIALAAVAPAALAGSATSDLSVSANVAANCSITTSAVAFGSYDPIVTNGTGGSDLAGAGSVSVSCTKGASSVTVGLGDGLHFASGTRNMDSSGNPLSYDLYQPPDNNPGTACPGTTPWGNSGAGLFSLSAPTSKAARTYNVCGTVPKGQDAAVGSYTDTVVATVNF